MYLFSFGKSSQKQIKAIQNQAEIKKIKKYTYNNEDIPLTSKQKEIFHKLVDERLDEITKSDKKVNSDLIYKYKGRLLMQNLMNLIILLMLYIK